MTRTEYHPHGEQLSAYIDSMLDVARMRGIGEHLRGCAACRSAETELRHTKFLVRGLPEPTLPPDDFWTSAYRQLRVNDRERAKASRPFWTVWRSPEQLAHRRWAAGLAAAAVTVGVLTAGPLSSVPHNPPAPPVRTALPVQFAVPQDVSPDVSSLAEMHTDSVSCLPLADPDRQKMIAADVQQSANAPANASEAAAYADASF